MVYFDHNASSPLLPEARTAWLEAEERFPGNPSSPHRMGARAEKALEEARGKVAAVLGCAEHEIVWTSGATEACNLVLRQVAGAWEGASDGGKSGRAEGVWVSAIEHPAVLETARRVSGRRVQTIPVGKDGVVEVGWLEARLKAGERPALVALMAANNETGVVQPWGRARELCATAGVAFFCDATQWCGRRAGRGLGACDFVAGSAHKFGGPRGVGFLKASRGQAGAAGGGGGVRPMFFGGKQQEGRRAGTENVAGVLAMVAALEWCEGQIAAGGSERGLAVRERFERGLSAAVPGAAVNGARVERLWNTVSVVMPEADCRQRWVVKLDRAGFAVSTGSACASGQERPSHVLTAMGLEPAEAGRALRFSAGWRTDAGAWEALLGTVGRIWSEVRDEKPKHTKAEAGG